MKQGADMKRSAQESERGGRSAPPDAVDKDLMDSSGVDPAHERMRELLRESELRFLQFAEASSDVLWIRDARSLQLEYLSPAFNRVYGLSRDGKPANDLLQWVELIVPEDRQ